MIVLCTKLQEQNKQSSEYQDASQVQQGSSDLQPDE